LGSLPFVANSKDASHRRRDSDGNDDDDNYTQT
jgi:hypothetical protein